jgi:DNA-binding FrmR family transcriptional regulator
MMRKSNIKIQKSKTIKQDRVLSRLNRVKGQVEGIIRMYEENPCDCISIVTQIKAARSALGKVAQMLLRQEAGRCAEEGELKKLEEIVRTTFKAI